MDKQNALEKAEEILRERKEALNRFVVPLNAGICPECGKNLILKTKEWTTKKKTGLFIFKKEVEIPHKHDYFACPDGHPIIDPEGCDRSDTGYYEYRGRENPNKVIREYWLNHYCGNDWDC